jgi:nucleoid DNA-binding protein
MTKADLVEQVADAIGPGITKKDCALVVDGFLNAVKLALAHGDNIEIRGFGTFKVRRRKTRMGRGCRRRACGPCIRGSRRARAESR